MSYVINLTFCAGDDAICIGHSCAKAGKSNQLFHLTLNINSNSVQENGIVKCFFTCFQSDLYIYNTLCFHLIFYVLVQGRAECPTFSQWLRRQCTLMSYFKSTLSPFHIDVRPSHDSAYKLVCILLYAIRAHNASMFY